MQKADSVLFRGRPGRLPVFTQAGSGDKAADRCVSSRLICLADNPQQYFEPGLAIALRNVLYLDRHVTRSVRFLGADKEENDGLL